MRLLSANQIKLLLKGRKAHPLQRMPREGTCLRSVYDRFVEYPGKTIEFNPNELSNNKQILTQLRIYYGLDIRLIKQGSALVERRSLWCLVGEWFGKIYIDYTADTEEQMDRLAEARYALQHLERPENVLPAGVHHLSKDSADILERVAAKGREIAEKHLKKDSDNG